MKKRDFETYQKRFRDFEILPKFSETHVFRGTIRHPFSRLTLKPWMSRCACAILFTSRSDLTRHEMGRIEVTVASRLLQLWSLGLRSSLSSQSINVMHMRHAYACVYDSQKGIPVEYTFNQRLDGTSSWLQKYCNYLHTFKGQVLQNAK